MLLLIYHFKVTFAWHEVYALLTREEWSLLWGYLLFGIKNQGCHLHRTHAYECVEIKSRWTTDTQHESLVSDFI